MSSPAVTTRSNPSRRFVRRSARCSRASTLSSSPASVTSRRSKLPRSSPTRSASLRRADPKGLKRSRRASNTGSLTVERKENALSDDALTQTRIQVATDYFRKVDSGDPTIVDIMTDGVEVYFPKFGVGRGKAAFVEVAQGLMRSLQSIQHDLDRMRFHVAGHHIIVEGFESGVMADGTPWPVEERSEGRFANVFEFEGNRIKRLYVYVDPDLASTHRERFLWGDNA